MKVCENYLRISQPVAKAPCSMMGAAN